MVEEVPSQLELGAQGDTVSVSVRPTAGDCSFVVETGSVCV